MRIWWINVSKIGTNQCFLLVIWSKNTTWVYSLCPVYSGGYKNSTLLVPSPGGSTLGFTFITFLSLLFLNSSPLSSWASTLKLGESFKNGCWASQLKKLKSVYFGNNGTFPLKYFTKSSVFNLCAKSMYPDISFYPFIYFLINIIAVILPLLNIKKNKYNGCVKIDYIIFSLGQSFQKRIWKCYTSVTKLFCLLIILLFLCKLKSLNFLLKLISSKNFTFSKKTNLD